MSHTVVVHGLFMNIFGLGTLLLGESGVGKSDLALSLISRGQNHQFIADDAVEFHVSENTLWGNAPPLIKSCLGVRSLGILDVTHLFGENAFLAQQKLSLAIQLKRSGHVPHTIDLDVSSYEILGISTPCFLLQLSDTRPSDILVETMVRNYQLIQRGENMNANFTKKLRNQLSLQKD